MKKMTQHDIINRLDTLNKFLLKSVRECGYTRDYDEALKTAIVMVADLGDEIVKPKYNLEEKV